MSETNETTELQEVAPTDIAPLDMDALNVVSKAGSWLPRCQFFSGKTKEVQEKKIEANHFAIIRDKKMTDLGERFECLVIYARAKAMRFGEKIITCFDPKPDPATRQATGIFADIMTTAESSNDEEKLSNMYGPEYLLWVPGQGFCTFFMGTKSARRESQHLTGLVGGAATISSKLAKTKKYSWYTPQIDKSAGTFDIPSREEIAAEALKFKNEKGSEVVSATEAGAPADER